MTKQHCGEPKNQTDPIPQVADPKYFQNYHPFTSHKTIGTEEDSPEVEDFLEEGDFPGEEDFPEEEDSQEEVGTLEAVEYHLEDHQEEDGGRHPSPYHKHNKESW